MILTPRPQPKSTGRRVAIVLLTLGLTAAIHAGFLALIVLSSLLRWDVKPLTLPQKPTTRPVVLRGLSRDQYDKNRGPTAPVLKDERTPLAKKEERKKEPEKLPEGQVVDVAPGNDQVDPNAKYLAATNNAVKKETRAKEQTPFYRNAMPRQTAPQATEGNGSDTQATRPQRQGNDGLGDDDRPLKEKATPKMALEVPDLHKREEVALKRETTEGPGVAIDNRTGTEELKGNSKRLNLVPGSLETGEDASAGRVGQAGVLNLLPSKAVVDKIVGGAPNDHLDADEGDGTYLNTREFKYASFFNRVKQSVSQNWTPVEQLRLRDPTGQIYGGRDRHTVLTITLDDTGRLKDAFVDKSSGLDFLDLEAIKAFERAQPFPNPPPGIVAADQTIRFQFGFFLEMTGRPGMRLFRSAQ
ncbi:MAG: energy transducer TonB family protein [Myxococcota bacterium]